MKCENCLALLDGYLEDELDAQPLADISEHLGGCLRCSSYYEKLLREQEVYESYFLKAEPTADLWKNIEAQIREEKASRASTHSTSMKWLFMGAFSGFRFSPIRGLALVSLAFALAFTLFLSLLRTHSPTAVPTEISSTRAGGPDSRKQSGSPPAKTTGAKENGPLITPFAEAPSIPAAHPRTILGARPRRPAGNSVQGASKPPIRDSTLALSSLPGEQSYVQTIAELRSEVEPMIEKLPANLRAEYRRNMQSVDRVITEARLAARRDSGSQEMADFVLSAYQGKLTLLGSMANLSMLSGQ